MQKITVNEQNEGGRLDKYLVKELPNAGLSFLYKMLRKKNITLNGKKATGKEILKAGDTVEMFFAEDTYRKFSSSVLSMDLSEYSKAFEALKGIEVVYEDENVAILNKPIGVLSQKAETGDLSINEWLTGYLLDKGETDEPGLARFKPSACNRLDRNTAGLILCGKSPKGSRVLSKLIKERLIDKYYLALVKGTDVAEGSITGSLDKNESNNKVRVKLGEEENIRTDISVLDTGNGLTLIEAKLITGKPHQIRASMAATGHPLIGDYKYGSKAFNDVFKAEFGLEAQFLCCIKVVFPDSLEDLPSLSGKTFYGKLPRVYEDILLKENIKWQPGTQGA